MAATGISVDDLHETAAGKHIRAVRCTWDHRETLRARIHALLLMPLGNVCLQKIPEQEWSASAKAMSSTPPTGHSTIYDMLKDVIPNDHSRQSTAADELNNQIAKGFNPSEVLDLGCGDGRSIDLFKSVLPEAKWTGVDIESSPEVTMRRRTDGDFVSFDGVNLPFQAESFGMVYSYQVFEHVRHPEPLLAEIRRVLKKDGLLIGQTSQLEPYHSFSYWNFTVFGFRRILEAAGLRLLVLRPGIDGLTLIQRSIHGRAPEWTKYFTEESPLNAEIEQELENKRPSRTRNFRKLIYCGQFVFVATPADGKK